MAAKTANIIARVEPAVKEQAEAILSQLGVPSSVVINMLYKQIILTKSIPFPISLPSAPVSREEMDQAAFDAMMEQGLQEAKEGRTRPADQVFRQLREELP